ncbi:propionyl-CoA carboxylase [Citrus sinensis]|nr:propionyl-CoA carboxylase [Citrus sinensis]
MTELFSSKWKFDHLLPSCKGKLTVITVAAHFNERVDPKKRRDKVYIGCGAGFGGDRPMAALKLLQSVKQLNYLVLECLAERTLADRFQTMSVSGDGYDSRMHPPGAQEKVLEIATTLGLNVSVAVAYEVSVRESGMAALSRLLGGAAPIVECLEKYQPNVIITSRVADAALFLAPMGSLAGHLLECGCQLTGGYFMHPGDKYRDISFQSLLDQSLPYAEISFDGKICVAKAEGSGGILNFRTCGQQLLYEVGDPAAYVTPDVVIDIRDVSFQSLSSHKVLCGRANPSPESVPGKLLRLVPKDCGWKGWGEVSYGGHECVKRARAAEFLVRSWMEEVVPGVNHKILSYIIGLDSLKTASISDDPSSWRTSEDIRLRMDGLFELKDHAVQFTKEFIALYTNGPAGGGGVSTGHKKEVILEKQLVGREHVFWQTGLKCSKVADSITQEVTREENLLKTDVVHEPLSLPEASLNICSVDCSSKEIGLSSAPSGQKIPLYTVCHSRSGDKGNDLNFSMIPHFPLDFERLKMIITPRWVKDVVSTLLNTSSFPDSDAINKRDQWVNEHVKVEIYEVRGIHSLNVVVRNILDGGVNCSRRIDRHGKSISDLILSQQVVLP